MKTKEEPLTPDFLSRDTEPFRVPDGYFEGLTNRILSALRPADRTTEQPLYVQHATTPSATADDEADFLDYLEAQYADLFFSDDINEWE